MGNFPLVPSVVAACKHCEGRAIVAFLFADEQEAKSVLYRVNSNDLQSY